VAPPTSISEVVSLALDMLVIHTKCPYFENVSEALTFMQENGYSKSLKTGSRELARQLAEEELNAKITSTQESLEETELSQESLAKLNELRKD